MYTCKLCDTSVPKDRFLQNFGICLGCANVLEAKVEFLEEKIPELLDTANSSTDPDIKILYLKTVLGFLYDYKINYYDKDVDILTEDVEDMIDTIIEGISYARL